MKSSQNMTDLLQQLLKRISTALDHEPTRDDPITHCQEELKRACKSKGQAESERNLAYKKLCDGLFSDAPLKWRRLYEETCMYIARFCVVEAISLGKNGVLFNTTWLDDTVAALDMAIIMVGAPRRRDEILTEYLPALQDIAVLMDKTSKQAESLDQHGCKYSEELDIARPGKRRRLVSSKPAFSPFQVSHPQLSHALPRIDNPSLTEFQQRLNKDHGDHQSPLPLVITRSIEHWPARQADKWGNPQYLLDRTLKGRRLVPIETGKSYTDDGWGQRIVPFRKFLAQFVDLSVDPNNYTIKGENGASDDDTDLINDTVYLAQYDLLSQIPALRDDICVPDYCYSEPPIALNCSASGSSSPTGSALSAMNMSEPKINVWLGPADTISPLHTDPHHNILAQVVGRKYVRLYSPRFTANLYPREGEMIAEKEVDMSNTSQIDLDVAILAVEDKQFGRDACEIDGDADGDSDNEFDQARAKTDFRVAFPLFKNAEYVEAILEPGDCLFIPKGWWHYVRSLSASFSVSFWWD